MSAPKVLLLGLTCPTEAEATRCYEIAERFLAGQKFSVYRLDALSPLRLLQHSAHKLFALTDPGDPYEPTRFASDKVFQEMVLTLYEMELGPALRQRINRMLAQSWSGPVAIITTDARNKVFVTMRELGYKFLRIGHPNPHEHHSCKEDHLVDENILIPWENYKKAPRRSVEAAVEKLAKHAKAATIGITAR